MPAPYTEVAPVELALFFTERCFNVGLEDIV